ncbi:MAG: ABC transporter substrate-binding protein [Pseudomonadota bacterium]
MTTSTNKAWTRRSVLGGLSATGAVLAFPVQALTLNEARALIDRAVRDITTVINSGRSESAIYGEFEKIFARYADVATISRSALGPEARSASASELRAFSNAFTGYMARKYGQRFREFVGGKVEVRDARAVKSFFEVQTVATLRGQAPFQVSFMVSDRSGKDLFFDMLIEGVSLLKAERTEIGAMLDQRRGDIARLTADLASAG